MAEPMWGLAVGACTCSGGPYSNYAVVLGLETMGFSEQNLKMYRWAIQQPYGMVLHVGPTGSGKTTTLYAALAEINSPQINIQTAEDPVEYMLQGINQTNQLPEESVQAAYQFGKWRFDRSYNLRE